MLAFGWETLAKMRGQAIHYASSAWGPNMPAPMFCDPTLAFSNLFGVARQGLDRRQFEADTEMFEFVRRDADLLDTRLPSSDRNRFQSYREGLATIAEQRRRLLAMSDRLERHCAARHQSIHQPASRTGLVGGELRGRHQRSYCRRHQRGHHLVRPVRTQQFVARPGARPQSAIISGIPTRCKTTIGFSCAATT